MSNWERFRRFFLHSDEIGISLDLSRMGLDDAFLASMQEPGQRALAAVHELEGGAIANPDENRQVGHYWLRQPDLAPEPALRAEIENTLAKIEKFCEDVHRGEIKPPGGARFTRVLSIGIGGSALGPQFVSQALTSGDDKLPLSFLDNTDPDGFDTVFREIGDELATTLTLVISKSGSTPETLNGMLEAAEAYRRRGLEMAQHAVAITGDGSVLDKQARNEQWIARFPMWDWVGGRTSVMSAVGLLPMGLQGLPLRPFLQGAAAMDRWTRAQGWENNPALALAFSWYKAGDGKGRKDMVVLPYKDRLALFSRYLQQLVMESLGKERDLQGNVVHQGIAVYGNKGSTDQHAYVQQLRDGLNNFFATFVVVLQDRQGDSISVGEGATSGDFLNGFWQGTRQALSENGRLNACITLPHVDAYQVGALIALYERTVSLYAQLVGVNAYHQPGVEAGKKAAKVVLELQSLVLDRVEQGSGEWFSAEQLAETLQADPEAVFLMLRHLTGSGRLRAQGQGLQLQVSSRAKTTA